MPASDYHLYHWINELAQQHHWLGQTAVVGAAAALLVVRLGRPLVERVVGAVECLTDPIVALVRRFAPRGPRPATD